MKATLRIPTKEQYAYIEVEMEGSQEEIMEKYNEMTKAVFGGFGLERLEFNKVIDTYLTKGTIESSQYESLSKEQQDIIQEIKRSFARLNK